MHKVLLQPTRCAAVPPSLAEVYPGRLFQPAPPPAAGLMTDGAGVPTGTPLPDPPLIEMISEDPVLRGTKLIAEAWDCDGLNQARPPGQGQGQG